MSFYSERGNSYELHILQKGYEGSSIVKKLGAAPVLAIEQGDGAIKGSSLAFAIQADVEGELRQLYTTDNKEFKVQLYRNNALYWQGYLLPELYSESYIDPPYDVTVTATDQLAVLKGIEYNQGAESKSLLDIITYILSNTGLNLAIRQHLNLTVLDDKPVLSNAYVYTEAYYGQTCYDVLNGLLLSCNACIQQINGEWVILSLTDSSSSYITNKGIADISHVTLGQMGNAQVCPVGSMELVNQPALKGATVNYSHLLRNSLLKNADVKSKDWWQYSVTDSVRFSEYPSVKDWNGVKYPCYCFCLPQKNIASDSSLQIWQDIEVKRDDNYSCVISVDFLKGKAVQLFLMSILHEGNDGKTRRLTAEGWKENGSASNVNDYIHITGEAYEKIPGIWDIADQDNYDRVTVQFYLPEVDGKLRVGFMNTTEDGEAGDPFSLTKDVYVNRIYLTYESIAGKISTSVVEENATSAQQEVALFYGDATGTVNDHLIALNTLRNSQGNIIDSFSLKNLSGSRIYNSYFLAMLQEMSRYYGVKKVHLQGNIMGSDVLFPLYQDVFSGKVMRLVSGQYSLLDDELSVMLEEVPTGFVDYDVEVVATQNNPSLPSSSGVPSIGGGASGGGASGSSGESYLALRTNGDVYVKNEKVLTGAEADFEQQAVPRTAPAEAKEGKAYVYAGGEGTAQEISDQQINLGLMARKVNKLWDFWSYDEEINAVKTRYNVLVEGTMAMKKLGTGGSGGGGGTASGSIRVYLGDVAYDSKNGVVNLPAYPSLAGYATESWVNNKGYLTAVTWDIVIEKPSFATVATSGKYSDLSGLPTIPTNNNQLTNGAGYITSAALNGYATESWVGANYLGLGGGTISGNYNAFTLNRNTANPSIMGFSNTAGMLGYLGMKWGNAPVFVDADAANIYDLIHSGNIGSQYVAGVYDAYNPVMKINFMYGGGGLEANPSWLACWNGYTLTYVSPNVVNVASATKLQTARSIWGQSFDGSGNITGNINLTNADQINGNWGIALCVDCGGLVDTSIWNGQGVENVRFKANGNVLMGTTTDRGHRLTVGRPDGAANLTLTTLNNSLLFVGMSNSIDSYGMNFWTEGSGNGFIQQGRTDDEQPTLYNLSLQPFGGNVLIGTVSDSGGKLQVNGDVRGNSFSSNPNDYFTENNKNIPWYGMSVVDGYNKGVYLTGYSAVYIKSAYAYMRLDYNGLYVSGNLTVSGGATFGGDVWTEGTMAMRRLNSSSDQRLKNTITSINTDCSMNVIKKLRPVGWKWNADDSKSFGFIAQEVLNVVPEMVAEVNNYLHLEYNQLHAFEVGAIQYIDNEVESLKKEVAALKKELQQYKESAYVN